jgi:hypothetical protein
MAIMTANAKTRRKYGRLGHSRVANLFKPEEGPHNEVARAQKEFRAAELAKLDKVVDKSKKSESVLRRLYDKIKTAVQEAKKAGSSVVKIEISIAFAQLLLTVLSFVIGLVLFVAYWGLNLFVGLFSGGSVMFGDTPKSIMRLMTGDDDEEVEDWR